MCRVFSKLLNDGHRKHFTEWPSKAKCVQRRQSWIVYFRQCFQQRKQTNVSLHSLPQLDISETLEKQVALFCWTSERLTIFGFSSSRLSHWWHPSVCPSHIFRFFSLYVSAPKAVTSSDFVLSFPGITVKMSACCRAILTVVLVSWLLSSCLCEKGVVVSFIFQTPAGCPGELARESPVSEVVTSPSVISCSALCASSPDCQAITFDPDSRTCQLFPESENCTGVKKAEEMMNYFVKVGWSS